MSHLSEIRKQLEVAAGISEDEFRALLEGLGPSEAEVKAFEKWLSIPRNRDRWNEAIRHSKGSE